MRTGGLWGAPPIGFAPFSSLQAAINYYSSVGGFGVYPWQDGSDGYTSDLAAQIAGWQSVGGVVLGPLDGWGYNTGFVFNAAKLYPNEQEYYLRTASSPRRAPMGSMELSSTPPSICGLWVQLYNQIDQEGRAEEPRRYRRLDSVRPRGELWRGSRGERRPQHEFVCQVCEQPPGFLSGRYDGERDPLSDGSPCVLWSLQGTVCELSGTGHGLGRLQGAAIPGTGIIPTVKWQPMSRPTTEPAASL